MLVKIIMCNIYMVLFTTEYQNITIGVFLYNFVCCSFCQFFPGFYQFFSTVLAKILFVLAKILFAMAKTQPW